jgi:putative transposase
LCHFGFNNLSGCLFLLDHHRLRELELENGKLKRLLAEAHLDIHALKSVFGTKR